MRRHNPRLLNEKSIFTRIINQHFMLVLFIVGALLTLVFMVSSYMVRKTALESYDESLGIASTQVQKDFDQLINAMDAMASDHEMRRYMVFNNQFGQQDNLCLPPVLSRKLADLENKSMHAELSIYTHYESVILNTFKPTPKYNLLQDPKFVEQISEDTVYYRYVRNRQGSIEAYAVVLPVMDFMSMEPLGYIQAAFEPKTLGESIRANAPFKDPMIFWGDNGEIIYSEAQSIPSGTPWLKSVNTGSVRISKADYLVCTKALNPHGINISLLVNSSELTQSLFTSFILILPLMALLILLDMLMSKRLVRRITEPLSEMIAAMALAEKGDFGIILDKQSGIREINLLNRSFSKMLFKIQNLIDTNYKAEILKQKAELDALQQKINPHFLYNSLELISSQAILDGSQNVSRMTQRLGRLFRYNLNAPEHVPIHDEIKYLKDYIALWQMNNHCQIQCTFTCNEDLLNHEIPKLLFQPFIENALKHGISNGQCKLKIDTNIQENDENLLITISDNGPGIALKTLHGINQHMKYNNRQHPADVHFGNGILNSRDRIISIYGSQYSLQYVPTKSKGTCVVIQLPLSAPGRYDNV